MKNIPQNIKRALNALRMERGRYVQLVRLGENYYAYEATTFYDKSAGRTKKVLAYIGKIDRDGSFRPKRERKEVMQPGEAKEVPYVQEPEVEAPVSLTDTERDREILMALSTDGRMSMAKVGKRVNLSTSAASYQVKKLEAKYGIRYIPEIDVGKLGYSKYIVMMRFLSGLPNAEELKQILSAVSEIQFAVLTNGRYDLLFYMLAKNNDQLSSILYSIVKRLGERFKSKVVWNVSPFYHTYGFIQIRDEFLETLREDVWTRTAGVPLQTASLTKNEYLVLKELNRVGNESFIEIDKRNEMTRMSSYYTYSRLIEKGIIDRVTISMDRINFRYLSIIKFRILEQHKFETLKPRFLSHLTSYTENPVNRYLFVGDIISVNGILMFLPVFSERDLETSLAELKPISSRRDVMIVTKILFGSICYRLFDNKLSKQTGNVVEAKRQTEVKLL